MKWQLAIFSLMVWPLAVLAQPAKTNSATGPAKADVCSLLTAADIQAIQGEKLQQAQLHPEPGKVVLSQCLFRTVTPSKSVSLALATPGAQQPSGIGPRQFWNTQFHGDRPGNDPETSQTSSENERQGEKPIPVRGLGDEAYWVGNSYAGALYVLKGETFFRLSVGGIRDQTVRLEKSKTLARSVLKRLQGKG